MARGRGEPEHASESAIRHDGDKMLSLALASNWREGVPAQLIQWEEGLRERGEQILEFIQGDMDAAFELVRASRRFGSSINHEWDPAVSEGAQTMLEPAQAYFPEAWLRRSHAWSKILPINVWLDGKETLTLAAYTHEDPMGGAGFYLAKKMFADPQLARAVIVHEWAHRMEALVPDIKTAAWAFRMRRQNKPLQYEYAWKAYGDAGPDRHTELFASGMEALTGGSEKVREQLWKDQDYCHWLLGVLTSL